MDRILENDRGGPGGPVRGRIPTDAGHHQEDEDNRHDDQHPHRQLQGRSHPRDHGRQVMRECRLGRLEQMSKRGYEPLDRARRRFSRGSVRRRFDHLGDASHDEDLLAGEA